MVAYLERAAAQHHAENIGRLSCGPGFRGCPFANAAAELADPGHPARKVVVDFRAWLVDRTTGLLEQLGAPEPRLRAEQLVMLRDGAMVAGHLGSTPESVAATLVSAGRAIIASPRRADAAPVSRPVSGEPLGGARDVSSARPGRLT